MQGADPDQHSNQISLHSYRPPTCGLLASGLSHLFHSWAPMVIPAPSEHPFKPALPIAGFSLPAIWLYDWTGYHGRYDRAVHPQPERQESLTNEVNCGPVILLRTGNKQGLASAFARKPLILDGARSRNRTGTPLRAGDFKSHASTSFAIRAVALCSEPSSLNSP